MKPPASPYLFLCGVPRSGTTLLQRMLNAHPELAVTNDTHFIPRSLELVDRSFIQQAINGKEIELDQRLIEAVKSYKRFYRLGIDDAEFDWSCKHAKTYRELVANLYATVAKRERKRLAGEKTPDYVRRVCLLHGLFPAAKLIHIIRDGRDVALSLLDWATPNKGPGKLSLWNEHPVAVAALWWRWFVMQWIKQASAIEPSLTHEVHYDDLIRFPKRTLEELSQFLGLPFSPSMLDYHRGKSRIRQDNQSAKSAWLSPQKGLRDWRRDMTESQVELFEFLAGDALVHFGFEITDDGYSQTTRNIGQQCLDWWANHFTPKHTNATSLPPQTQVGA